MIKIEELKKEVWACAEEVGIKPKEVHVREMRRKWASCSSRGRLTFSVALLNEARSTRMEAIVHELLHLKYPNHGEMFKALLAAYLSKKGIKVNMKF
jgi:predicted metal-dependent hydrolase